MEDLSQDKLLAELNGGSPMPPMIDEAPTAAPSRENELTVPAPSKPSPVAAADAVHATRAGGKGYRVRVKGEYYALGAEGRGKVKRPYTAEFNLASLDKALSIIKNKLLTLALKKAHPDFAADRTCFIVDATPLSPATPKSNNLAYMDRGQLEEYVRASAPRIPIDPSPENYPDVTHLREAIIDYIQTPDGFAEREKERQEKRAEDRELAALNPGLEVGA
jgi:hypothetical protein